jgi:S1-C subfamily serine protease
MTRMEELTQTQIVLLTLLVSFITSIATGIITTSLLAEAPTSVTQTINRVVERTIETVAPPIEGGQAGRSSTIKEITIVKEEDAVIAAIEKSSQGIVRIRGPVIDDIPPEFYSIGIVVSSDGLIISDLRTASPKDLYTVILPDGTSLNAHSVSVGTADNLGVFKVDPNQIKKVFSTVIFSASEPKLGQSVIAIEGKDKNTVALGRVLGIQTQEEKNSEGQIIKVAYSINTDISPSGEIPGAPLFNLSGELVGIKNSNDDLSLSQGMYTTVVPINRVIAKARTSQ